jgi:F0F1-type ATP synthase assembly protein I
VLNSLITGRRLALRIVLVQLLVAALLALAFLLQGTRSAMAAGMGGGAVVLGSGALALRAFTATPVSPNIALLRMLIGMALKWVLILATLYIALVRFALPPLPLLVGAVVTTMSFLFAAKLNA